MTVQRNATVLLPHITRKAAYDRRTDGLHMTLTEWVDWKRRQFEARTRNTGSGTARAGSHLIDGWRD